MKLHFFKTIAIIGICLLFSANSYGQTKEETITWLKEKIVKYIDMGEYYKDFKIEKLDECSLVYSYTYYDNKEPFIFSKNTIPINDIKTFRGGFIDMESKSIVTFQRILLGFNKGEESVTYYDYFGPFRKGEDEIYARIEKAFKHLAAFCEKKNETF